MRSRLARPRAIAIPSARKVDEKWLMMIHALLALMIPAFLLFLAGCQKDEGHPVDYGPEVQSSKIDDALWDVIAMQDPLDIQLGQFVHSSHSQELAMGASKSVLSDAATTVIDREEADDAVYLSIAEMAYFYDENGAHKQAPTESTIRVDKPTPTPIPVPTIPGAGAQTEAHAVQQAAVREFFSRPLMERLVPRYHSSKTLAARSVTTADEGDDTSDEETPQVKVTFHRLTTSVLDAPPPLAVQKQANCAGVPNCSLHIYKISYDAVIWDSPQGNRVRIENEVSPDVPFLAGRPYTGMYPGLVSQCVTQQVPIPKSQSQVLLKDCVQLENFRFTITP